jgi:Fic family protein
MTNINIINRPVAPHWYGKPGREPKSFYNAYYRAVWAYDLCKNTGDVTEEQYSKAVTLLNAVNRYACADAHQWERAATSARYANSSQREEDEKALDERRAKLQKRLAEYGAHLENFGLYPTICDSQNHRICGYGNE